MQNQYDKYGVSSQEETYDTYMRAEMGYRDRFNDRMTFFAKNKRLILAVLGAFFLGGLIVGLVIGLLPTPDPIPDPTPDPTPDLASPDSPGNLYHKYCHTDDLGGSDSGQECHENATYLETQGRFTCQCKTGYSGDG